MKALLTAFLTIFALSSISAIAEQRIGGDLAVAPVAIKVKKDDGSLAEYTLLSLNRVDADKDSIRVTENGLMARCGDYLGQLAADFKVSVRTQAGQIKTAIVRAASGAERKVSVFGMCRGNTNDLSQLQIDIKKGDGVEFGEEISQRSYDHDQQKQLATGAVK